MTIAFSYLATRLWRFFADFFEHWYLRSFLLTSHHMLELFEELDRSFALRINFKHLFKPLYQDRSVIGYIMGFISRFFRIIVASVVYIAVFVTSVVLYALWLVVPPYLVFKVITSYVPLQ